MVGVILSRFLAEGVPDQQLLAQHAEEAGIQPAPVETFPADAVDENANGVQSRCLRRTKFYADLLADPEVVRRQPLSEVEGMLSQTHILGIDVPGGAAPMKEEK